MPTGGGGTEPAAARPVHHRHPGGTTSEPAATRDGALVRHQTESGPQQRIR